MKKLFYFFLAAIALVACDNGTEGDGTIQSVTINKAVLELVEGGQQRLSLTVTPEDAEYSATWSSENELVASVSNKGVVTANTIGETTITVAIDGTDLKATCHVVVKSLLDATVFDQLILYNTSEKQQITITNNAGEDTTVYTMMAKFMMLPSTMYVDGEGYLAGDPGYVMDITTSFLVEVNEAGEITALIALADYTLVDNAISEKGYFIPWTIQIGHFDKDNYGEYWTQMILYQNKAIDEEPLQENYPYFDELDTYIGKAFVSSNGGIGYMENGYPTIAEGNEAGIIQVRLAKDKKSPYPNYYDFDAKLFGEGDQLGFALEERVNQETGETGYYYMDNDSNDIFDLAEMVDHRFVYGKYDDGTSAVSVATKLQSAQSIPAAQAIKNMKVFRALNVPFMVNFKIK